jgi:hypothetical protein
MNSCLYETIEKSRVERLLSCIDIPDDCRKQLKQYLKKYDNKKKGFFVEYETHGLMLGRKYAKNSLSLQNFNKTIRETLVHDTHTDLDIQNCHFVLLNQYCEKNNFKCPCLDEFVNNRDYKIQEIINLYSTTRKIAKDLFITMLYGGNINNYCLDYGFDVTKNFPDWVNELNTELIKITDIVCSINPDIFEGVKKLRKKNYVNKKASCLSYVLQIIEDKIVTNVCVKLKQLNLPVDTLCFDGVLVNSKNITNDILEELQSYCFETTGYKVSWSIKPMENHYQIIEKQYDFSNYDFKCLDEYSQLYCSTLISNIPAEQYALRKAYIEHFLCKVQQPEPLYIFQNGIHKKPDIHQPRGVQTLLKPIMSGFITPAGEIPFYDKWSVDVNHRLYRTMDFLPYNNDRPINDPNIFNIFEGFNPDIYGETLDKQTMMDRVAPYLKVVKELCGGEDKNADYFNRFIAQIFQDPSHKVPICIVIKGKQGVGKNVILDAIGNMLNPSHYITSSKPNDFFGEHAEGYYKKLLVNLNEAEGKDTFDFEGKIKSFISEDRIMINPKNVRPYEVNNLARTIITTNKQNPIPIDVKSKDRRYVVFQSTDHYLGDRYKNGKFWKVFYNNLRKPETMTALYQYFMSFDLSTYAWINKRPVTQAYKDMCSLYSPIEALFFEEFYCLEQWKEVLENGYSYEKNDDIKINTTTLFEMYEKFCRKNRFLKDDTKATSIRSFISKINGLELPVHRINMRTSNGWLFCPEEIYKFIENKRWINSWKTDIFDGSGSDGEDDDNGEDICEEELLLM